LVGVKAELFLDVPDVVGAERGTVDRASVLLGRAEADDGADVDEGGLAGRLFGLLKSGGDAGELYISFAIKRSCNELV
jgi:hypothetical protein